MKTNYLFPNSFKVVSGILFLASFLLLVALFVLDSDSRFEMNSKVFAVIGNDGFMGNTVFFGLIENSIVDELLMLIIIPAGIVYAFSKEKQEDEFVASIRLHSLAWATILNYGILLFCYLFIYGLPYLNVLMGAMFSQLLIFIALFRIKMYRFYNSRQDEE